MLREIWSFSNRSCSQDSLADRLRTPISHKTKCQSLWADKQLLSMKLRLIGNLQKLQDKSSKCPLEHKHNLKLLRIPTTGELLSLISIMTWVTNTTLKMKRGGSLLPPRINRVDRCLVTRQTNRIIWIIITRDPVICKNAPHVVASSMRRPMRNM
jgi:hypothetical protein